MELALLQVTFEMIQHNLLFLRGGPRHAALGFLFEHLEADAGLLDQVAGILKFHFPGTPQVAAAAEYPLFAECTVPPVLLISTDFFGTRRRLRDCDPSKQEASFR